MKKERIRINDLLEPFEELLGSRPEPELLTLTEKRGFVAQSAKYNKRVARDDTSDYKVIRKFDVAFNPYLLWAGAIAQNVDWDVGLISPLYPTFHIRQGYDPRFVDYLLGSEPLRLRYDSISFGSVPRKRRSSVADFLNLEIPKPPPLAEQRRISKVLDQAETLRVKRRAAISQLGFLSQSLFLDLFGDPATNPKGWPVKRIGDLVESIRTWNPSRSSPHEPFTYIDLSAIDQNNKRIREAREISCGEAPSRARQLVARGDVLVSTVRPNLNGVACVSEQHHGATASTGFCVLRAREQQLEHDYLFHWVTSPAFIVDMVNKATGASYPAVSDRIIFDSLILLPPLPLQREFARRATRVEKLRMLQRASLTELNELFASLQHRAFRGEL